MLCLWLYEQTDVKISSHYLSHYWESEPTSQWSLVITACLSAQRSACIHECCHGNRSWSLARSDAGELLSPHTYHPPVWPCISTIPLLSSLIFFRSTSLCAPCWLPFHLSASDILLIFLLFRCPSFLIGFISQRGSLCHAMLEWAQMCLWIHMCASERKSSAYRLLLVLE